MKYFIALVLMLVTLSATSQNIPIGIKGGLTNANLKSDIDNVHARLGYHFGVFNEINISGSWSLQPEILYASEGNSYTSSQANLRSFRSEVVLESNALVMPVLLKYRFGKCFIEGGPNAAFLLNTKTRIKEFTIDGIEQPLPPTKSHSGDFEASFRASLGFGYQITPKLSADLRYNHSFDNGGLYEYKGSIFQFSVNYQLFSF